MLPSAPADEPQNEIIRLANGEWPPYTGQRLPGYGCDSQVVTEAFALVGIRVEYVFLPWARGKLLSQNGFLDGAVEWEDTQEHRKGHYVSCEPLSTQEYVFFYRKGTSVDWQRLEDLHPLRIGLTIGYVYSEAFEQMRKKFPATFSESASDTLNFKRLLAGQIDLFPMEKTVGQYLLKTKFTANERASIAIHPKAIRSFAPHLLLSRAVSGNARRMRLYEQGLYKLKFSSRYQEVMNTCNPDVL
nr:transporter substrate-binding domain-containing protein [uncultured Desulfobulbus sp.]